MRLPDLHAGLYRHYKGPLYQVLGYAHDANADELFTFSPVPLGERPVVVYIGLQLTDAHTGPRLAVRTAEDFHAWVHQDDSTTCPNVDYVQARYELPYCSCAGRWFDKTDQLSPPRSSLRQVIKRFTYIGPSWEGDDG